MSHSGISNTPYKEPLELVFKFGDFVYANINGAVSLLDGYNKAVELVRKEHDVDVSQMFWNVKREY